MMSWSQISSFIIVCVALLAPLSVLGKVDVPWYAAVLVEFTGLVIGLVVGKISNVVSLRILASGERSRFSSLLLVVDLFLPIAFMAAVFFLSAIGAGVVALFFS
jgi:hypothetical protein